MTHMISRLSYDREHDACGIGAVVKIDGIPEHSVMDDALSIVEKLEHRAGKDASGTVGDGRRRGSGGHLPEDSSKLSPTKQEFRS